MLTLRGGGGRLVPIYNFTKISKKLYYIMTILGWEHLPLGSTTDDDGCYWPSTKLQEGNVLIDVCLSTGVGGGGAVCIHGTNSLWGGYTGWGEAGVFIPKGWVGMTWYTHLTPSTVI